MNKPFCEKISELRKAGSLTQEKLGEKLGVSSQAVSKWENGESMPDILLLPHLCEILGVSMDTLLEVPSAARKSSVMSEFTRYAAEQGISQALIDAFIQAFSPNGSAQHFSGMDFGPEHLCIHDKQGMGFVVNGEEYLNACLNMDREDLMFILRILSSEAALSVLRLMSMNQAITREEISQLTHLNETEIDHILVGFFKRGMVVFSKDASGKRGYLQGDGMAGVYMILAGCRVLSNQGTADGYKRFTRLNTSPSAAE